MTETVDRYGIKSSTFKKVARFSGEKSAVLVTGDRWWNDQAMILKALGTLPFRTILIHGNASGADGLADLAALQLGIPRIIVPYFGCYGRAGGPIRNTAMLQILLSFKEANHQDFEIRCFAFHDDLGKSKGTKDMVQKCKDAKVPIRLFKHKTPRKRTDAP